MRVISRKALRVFWKEHADAERPLQEWYKLAKRGVWKKFADVRATFASADQVNQFVVFDVGGNKFRLIAFIDYHWGKLFVRHVLTHKEYDQGTWKTDDFGRPPPTKGKRPKKRR